MTRPKMKKASPWPIRPTGQKADAVLTIARNGPLPAESVRHLSAPAAAASDFYRQVLQPLEADSFLKLTPSGWGLTREGSALACRLADYAGQPLDTPPAVAQACRPMTAAPAQPIDGPGFDARELTAGMYRRSMGTGDMRPPLLRAGSLDAAKIPSGGYRSRDAETDTEQATA